MNISIDKSYDVALLGMLLHFIPDGGGKLNSSFNLNTSKAGRPLALVDKHDVGNHRYFSHHGGTIRAWPG